VDLARFVDPTPLSVAPRLPLATTLELFNKMGPRVILVERRGILLGLVTIKDVLRFSAASEAAERGGEAGAERTARRYERQVWAFLVGMAGLFAACVGRFTGGRIKLGADHDGGAGGLNLDPEPSADPRDARGIGAEGYEGEALIGRTSGVSSVDADDRDIASARPAAVSVELDER
jgi:hypothetical protein